jgi:PAS domain S-box-containing protein
MAALSSLGEVKLFNRRGSGREELEALLDILPEASLLVDGRNSKILLANSLAIQLSAYTRKELSELQLSTLLPELSTKRLSDISGGAEPLNSIKLVTRSSQSLEVSATFNKLGGADDWWAVSLAPSDKVQQEQREQRRQVERWEALHHLSLAGQQLELSSSFRQILQAGSLLTGAPHLALYTGQPGGDLTLSTVAGSGLAFPAKISEAEMGKLRSPLIWRKGRAINSSLHKVAHSSQLSYLASTPLDQSEYFGGLIVAAAEKGSPSPDLLSMLQLLATSASSASLTRKLLEEISAELSGLKHSKQLSDTLQSNVEDGLLILNSDLKIEHVNPSAVEIFGYSEKEAASFSATDVLISPQALLKSLEQVVESGESLDLGKITLHRRNGSEFPARVRISPLLAKERTKNIVVIINDLSENQALHLHSQKLQQRAWLGEVTAIFAHEVRNPINNMSTGLQLMELNLDDDDPMQAQIKRLQEDCDRLEHRMKSVLSFSRTLEHKPEAIDIGEFCKMQLERWRPRMERKNIDHHLQVKGDTPEISGDRRALDQVFTNLITNAIQAMDEQKSGVIAIKIALPKKADDKDFVEIQLSDTGPGIPEDLRKRVFDPFFTTKVDADGTGLGLAITRRIIMAHKGKIELESFPGGTLFKILLPISTETNREENQDK